MGGHERLPDLLLPAPVFAVDLLPLVHVHDAGRGSRIGAGGHQAAHHCGAASGRGVHERRLAPLRLTGIHDGPVVEKGLHRGEITGRGGVVERLDTGRIGPRRRARTLLQKDPDEVGGALPSCEVERSVVAQARHGFGMCPRHQEDLRQFGVAVLGGPVESGHAVAVGGVHVLATPKHGAHTVGVVGAGGVGDGRVGHGPVDDGRADEARPGGGRGMVMRRGAPEGESRRQGQPRIGAKDGAAHGPSYRSGDADRGIVRGSSPVLSPKLSMSSWPSVWSMDSMALAMGVPSGALR